MADGLTLILQVETRESERRRSESEKECESWLGSETCSLEKVTTPATRTEFFFWGGGGQEKRSLCIRHSGDTCMVIYY